ncbi:kynureninase/PvdN C-terminal domain-containing protein [Parasphingorhabdus cellanae]|uniref:Class V aminotransferase n=1 Tax=Parasphingorhabdus cellanae TaxID=2806553 RepID=A0ABX7T3G8_9SPHN|nr:class V aminotransferase [Parasphingorhabdus cellanae]QTD56108.1 class V aminotransferase [Parasphingorhabdus cellanae]
MSWKSLFSKAFAANPNRLHFAAHSHHLWPDAAYSGHMAACDDAMALADHKWDKIMGPVWSEAQGHIAAELKLPDPQTIAFAPNTHDFLIRIMSAIPAHPVRVLTTDGEFHSFRRQMDRWSETGKVIVEPVAADALVEKAQTGDHHLIFASQVLFNSGTILDGMEQLAGLARPDGPWVVIDGYHGYMALDTDLSPFADMIFYMSGGYKYAMAGEGVCFLHAPPGYAPRPPVTGWYAAFDDLALPPGEIGYAPDGRRFLGSTFDPSGLYRFNAVQAMLRKVGLSTAVISEHVAKLQTYFVGQDPLPNMVLLNPLDENPHARFLAYKGQNAASLHASLTDRNIVTDVRGDVLRIGFAIYHDIDDVDRLIAVIANMP